MDGLLTCAKAFEDLLPVKYHIIIGRKGKSVDLTVSFEAVEFHHLVGLHKLHDLRLSRASREKVFSQILSGQITLEDIKKSRYFCNIQNLPMCISFSTKKTRPGIFSVALFFQRRTEITQKVRPFIPF